MPDNQTLTLPDLTPFNVDLTAFRYEKGDDTEFINKANGKQVYLEDFFTGYNTALTQYGQVILTYLEAAQDVPIEIRQQFEQLVQDAQAAAQSCASAAAGLNLPTIDASNHGQVLQIKDDGSGYGLIDLAALLDVTVVHLSTAMELAQSIMQQSQPGRLTYLADQDNVEDRLLYIELKLGEGARALAWHDDVEVIKHKTGLSGSPFIATASATTILSYLNKGLEIWLKSGSMVIMPSSPSVGDGVIMQPFDDLASSSAFVDYNGEKIMGEIATEPDSITNKTGFTYIYMGNNYGWGVR